MRHRLWWVLIPTLASAALTATLSYYYLPTRYQTHTTILVVPQRVPESYVRSTVTTRIEDRLQSLTQQIMSRTRQERIIRDFNLYADERKSNVMEDVVERMRRDIHIEVVNGDAFRVSYISDAPRTAMRVTERLASLFIEENLRDREVLAEGTSQFLESQTEDLKRRIIAKEAELKTMRAKAGGAPLSEAELLPYEVLKDSYKSLLTRQHEARMSANLERRQIGEQFKLLDPARLPERPVGPRRTVVNLLGASLGLGVGLAFVGISARRKKE
jgi:uncharacterized protein involved in exopolysaccharide biosynthesis